METGTKVFKAQGSAFYVDGSASFYIEEGIVTSVSDDAGRPLVSLHGGHMYVPLDERWRAERSAALLDARDAVRARAIRLRDRADEIDRKAQGIG